MRRTSGAGGASSNPRTIASSSSDRSLRSPHRWRKPKSKRSCGTAQRASLCGPFVECHRLNWAELQPDLQGDDMYDDTENAALTGASASSRNSWRQPLDVKPRYLVTPDAAVPLG